MEYNYTQEKAPEEIQETLMNLSQMQDACDTITDIASLKNVIARQARHAENLKKFCLENGSEKLEEYVNTSNLVSFEDTLHNVLEGLKKLSTFCEYPEEDSEKFPIFRKKVSSKIQKKRFEPIIQIAYE